MSLKALIALGCLCGSRPGNTQGFSDNFDAASISSFWNIERPELVTLTSDHALSGSQSLQLSASAGSNGGGILWHKFDTMQSNTTVSVSLFDSTPGQATRYAELTLYSPTKALSLGISDWDGSIYWWSDKQTPFVTSVPRTPGWHDFVISASDSRSQLFIDSTLIADIPQGFQFNQVNLQVYGPWWRPSGTFYFDNFRLGSSVPEPGAMALLVGLTGAGAVLGLRHRRRPQ